MDMVSAFESADYRVKDFAVPVLAKASADAVWVTEALMGEPAQVLELSGAWARIVLPLQPSSLDGRGYPGWMPRGSLIESSDQPRYQIITPRAPVMDARGRLVGELPLGALLCSPSEREEGAEAGALELSDSCGRVRAADIAPWPLPVTGRETVLKTLDVWRLLPYVWGGTSSCTGTDCSGLVYRTYSRAGIIVPRDAHDQFRMAPRRGEGTLSGAQAGDLVFFRYPDDETISHVGVYLGDGTYLSTKGKGNVRVDPVLDDPYCGWASYLDD